MKAIPILVLLGLLVTNPLVAAKEKSQPEKLAADRDRAIAKAFAFLDKRLFAMADVSGTPTKAFTFAIAGLDHVLAGRTRAGADPVPKILGYLETWVGTVERRYRDPSQILSAHRADSRYLTQVNWPLAQTAVLLVELDARGRYRERSRRLLKKIVALLAAAQEPNGGWGHEQLKPATKKTEPERPGVVMISGYPRTLIAPTNVVASSLGIVRAARGKDSVKGLDRAVGYYRKARLDDGNFPYDERQNASNETGVGRAAGALLALRWLGVPKDDADFQASLAFVTTRLPQVAEGHGSPALNVFHGAFLMRCLGDDEWKAYRTEYLPRIVAAQAADGALGCVCRVSAFGVTCDSKPMLPGTQMAKDRRVYVTAMHLFVLLLDRSKLSLLAKKPVPAKPATATTPR